ncbi:hypothetical protein [Fluviispira multicolorata]|uniref:Uncharacterized protein n=1 Tax=Fluviispira multicolorata TaxID=2654512 RepID=A0A833N437_9BACT|nr:hypothetical protein [Fluviispira multicolorata]KAB8029866.1 hypothetical protein GCL57_10025 [Fluviispira multicolorata]
MKNYLILFFVLMITSCGNKSDNQFLVHWQPPESHWQDPNPELSNELNSLIQNQLLQLNTPCRNDYNTDQKMCELVAIEAGEVKNIKLDKESEGLRILLIDDSSMRLAAYTRYRQRVILNLKENNNGKFIPDNTLINIPRITKNILLDTFSNSNYEKIPYELSTPSSKLFAHILNRSLQELIFNSESVGHGNSIFNFIANNNPKSKFILAYTNEYEYENILKSEKNEDNIKRRIDNLFLNQSNDFKFYIKKYKINFISLSSGISIDSINKTFNTLPTEIKKYIVKSYYINFIDNLLKNNDSILIQSNVFTQSQNIEDDLGYYADCKKHERRFRIGYVRDMNYSISRFGSRDDKLISGIHKNSMKCTDIYINFSVEKESPYNYNKGTIAFSFFNIGALTLNNREISSSNATPVALSYLLYLKSLNPELDNHSLIKIINILKGDKFIILDPSYHKQFPVYEYNYLR